MNLKQRLGGIAANLDDLQAGIEAGSRAADTLRTDTTQCEASFNAPLLRAVARHVKDLQTCARDQRAAMQELRDGVNRLQQELTRSNGAVRPPPIDDRNVRRCLLCGDTAIEATKDGRVVTTSCRACRGRLRIEFNPPDDRTLRARIERLDVTDAEVSASDPDN